LGEEIAFGNSKEVIMNENSVNLIEDWHTRVKVNQNAHYGTAQRFNKLHYAIGLPAIILSAIAGATLLIEVTDPRIRIMVGLIGLLAAVLSGVQTFYSHAKRAEIHRVTAIQLGQLRRDIEKLEKFPPKDRITQAKLIKQISDRIYETEKGSLIVDTRKLLKPFD
jgi:hypothetical protein